MKGDEKQRMQLKTQGRPRRKLSRRAFLRCLGGGVVATGIAGLGYARYGEPRRLTFPLISITLPGLPAAFRGFRIVQLSDIHYGPALGSERLNGIIASVNALSPDLIVLTGDYADSKKKYIQPCLSRLTFLQAKFGKYGVLGNHDHWADAGLTREHFKKAKIEDLTNRHLVLEKEGSKLYLAGVDDLWEGEQDLKRALRGVPDKGVRILLSHNPDYAETMQGGRVDLMLSGHTHGGQVYLPVFGAPLLPSRFGQKYRAGLIRAEKVTVYVSKGIGTIYPHVRLFCSPEIPTFVLA